MLPLRDNVPSRSFPLVNLSLIAANALIFIYQLGLRPMALNKFLLSYAMIPSRLSLTHPSTLITLITAIFLHGGWLHILSNMWVLFIFGDNVEDRMGHKRYLIFFLLGGIVANLLQVFVYPTSTIPSVGASGAIAGVLGAYFLLFPGARVATLIPIFFYPWVVEISAFVFLGFWFVMQLFSGITSLSMPAGASVGGIAWWAHIGGFMFGLLTVRVFARRPAVYYYQPPNDWTY
jgi:membrane associated rhomboid family serine protease